MRRRIRATVELVVAGLAVVGGVLSWLSARSTMSVPPIVDGEPATSQFVYSPPAMVLALLLVTVAGVLVVLAAARLRRD